MRWIRSGSCALRRVAAVAALTAFSAPVAAHSPHHIVTDLAVEAAPGGDVFIVITDQVFRSDGGDSPWKNLDRGLDIRHPFTSVTMSPRYGENRTVFLTASGDGVFKSSDGGESWTRINEGLGDLDISDLFVTATADGAYSLHAASASGGLWRRAADDPRWQEVLSRSIVITSMAASDNAVLFAGDSAGTLWRSDDGGRLWERFAQVPDAGAITAIAVSGDTLFAGTGTGGLHAGRGGALEKLEAFAPQRTHRCSGDALEDPVADDHVTSVALSAGYADNGTVFATTWYNAVHVSTDEGRSWRRWSTGLSCDRQADSERLPHFSKITANDGDGLPFWVAAFDGLFVSAGPDHAWRQLETLPLGMIKGFAAHQDGDESPVVALATYGGGFYLTRNVGADWTIGNRGLITTRLTGIAFSRYFAEDDALYAGADGRLLVSADAGESWDAVLLQKLGLGAKIGIKLKSLGAPRPISRLFFDPSEHRRVYPSHIITQERPWQDEVLFATRFHGVMSYNRDSRELDTVWGGTDRIMNTFVASPDFAADRTLFASVRGEGIIRSTDGGDSWTRIVDGLAFVGEWAVDPGGTNFRRDVQIAVSPNYASDRTLFAGSAAASGIFRSRDGGDSWQQLDLLGGRPSPVLAVAVSPRFVDDGMLVASVRGHGLFRSRNGGDTFEPMGRDLFEANASIEYLYFSARFAIDRTMLAASDEELFVSRDGGDTWRAVDRPVRYEDMRHVVRFDGDWTERRDASFSAMTERVSRTAGSRVTLDFFGTGIRLIGSSGPDHGEFDVFIDGERVDTIDTMASEPAAMQDLFSMHGLPFGAHRVEVVSRADGKAVAVDAFDVLYESEPAE